MSVSPDIAESSKSGLEPRLARSDVRSVEVSSTSSRGLDWLNFFLADIQTGVGPFIAIYLAGLKWDEQMVGIALTVSSIAGILMQTPAGALVDQVHHKRALTACAVTLMSGASLMMAFFSQLWPIMIGQAVTGGVASVFVPAVCAMSLGIVGHEVFDARQARNQMFNSAGNVVAALAMGLLAYCVSDRSIFFFIAFLALPTLASLWAIDARAIDYARARGSCATAGDSKPTRLRELMKDRPLAVLLVASVLFHFANAAMLPLLGEMLGKGKGRASMIFMSACVITTQLVITFVSPWAGKFASKWGRKPILLLGFAVLPLRGLLYTLTDRTPFLIGIQILDGVGVGIFGVVAVLMIADLTRGTGRFNVTLGAISTAVGIGAALSQTIAGGIVHHWGHRAGFSFLAGVAMLAVLMLWRWMPETRARQEFPCATRGG